MELKEQFEALTEKLEGKSLEARNEAFAAFESKMNESLAGEVKAVKEAAAEELKAVQGHLDKLDAKMQEKKASEATKGDAVKELITKNFDEIKNVTKAKTVEFKAVGDMTLPTNLIGDEPRQYQNTVVMVPSQKVNSSDLIGAINLGGGTFTYPKEVSSEGGFAFQTSESDAKSQIDYDIEMIDATTNFLAGFARYSKKMRNNLPYLESFLPQALRRDYYKQENSEFYTELSTEATPSTLLAANFDTPIEQILADKALLLDADYDVTGITVRPSTWDILRKAEKSTGAGYGFPAMVTIENGVMRLDGIPVYQATWIPANKYVVGDWSRVSKLTTEGLGLEFSENDSDNFTKNMITARLEAQIGWAFQQPASLILGDITAA